MPSDKPDHPERTKTDASLTAERGKTDARFTEWSTSSRDETDIAVRLARERADRILAATRNEEDREGAQRGITETERGTIQARREREDAALHEERGAEDKRFAVDRAARDEIVKELLRIERQQTDTDLALERMQLDKVVRTQDNFFAMVSHDIRNLLSTASLTLAQLARDPSMADGQLPKVARIQRVLAQMARLTNDLTDIASIKAGRIAVEPGEADLAAIVRDVVDSYRGATEQKGLTLRTRLSTSLPGSLDRDRLLQVVGNLLNNAEKFTPSGGHIEVTGEREGETLHLAVGDDGPGIAADKHSRIFEAFQQERANDRRGFGLGLFISRNIVEAHGGRIWVESAPGSGSTFHITLPAASTARTRQGA